jgi:membrane protease YdiL (CAAX protease family)
VTRSRAAILAPSRALLVLVAGLATVNVLRSTVVPSRWHFVLNLGIGAGAVLIAVLAGLGAAQLGLARSAVGTGLRYGSAAFVTVSAAVVGLGVAGILSDDRVDLSAGAMLARTLVVIPLGTVLVEELVFRGTLHGLLPEVVTRGWAFALGAVLFGLWHVVPAWRSDGGSTGAVELGRLAGVLGTFAATTAAGVALIWLRDRSHSLIAPILAHLATNSVTFAVAWAAR